jgi:hypothetical protein
LARVREAWNRGSRASGSREQPRFLPSDEEKKNEIKTPEKQTIFFAQRAFVLKMEIEEESTENCDLEAMVRNFENSAIPSNS